MPAPPWLEMSADGVEQFGLRSGLLGRSGSAEEPGADFRIPVNIVPAAHLIFEEPRQQQALRARRFHHQAVAQQGRVGDNMVEDHAEIRGSRPIEAS